MLGVNRSMALHLDSIPVPPSDYWHATNSPLVLIYPLEGKEEEVYQGFLTASMTEPFTVYETENSPEEWHYGPTPHSPPFFIVADKGYTFSDDAWLLNTTPKGLLFAGTRARRSDRFWSRVPRPFCETEQVPLPK
ncbi:unnamed protein product [Darwinula stevensoni]|uniref:Uncharacterized protein n=1 Tax=Darwinula stevensoni TaxID=69355 RepID=A0A7R9AFW8_9CRUS|nr:unnamed protein product [Darwinula stevensoni]CAG0903070.1 unnamed protein product [Darwinula stevensoni]